MFVKGLNYHEEKRRLREEKREAKNRRREEKRAEKNRYREAKRRLRDEFRNGVKNHIAQFLNTSTSETTTQRSNNNNNNNNNVVVSNYDINDRVEQDVATIRTIFPDCDPEYIRNCLTKEPVDRVRKVTEKLLTTVYPKVAPESHSTIPTAPPLPSRSSCEFPFNDEPPPTYEESLGQGQSQSQSQGQGNLLQPPPLPKRHQRSSSWNGTSVTSSSQSTRPTRPTQLTRQTQHSSSSCPAAEVTEAIGAAVKNLIANFKPSTVETACHKHSHVWTRPAPTNLRPHSLSQQLKISPKDKYSIQRGFSPNNYPSRELNKHHDISEEDWYLFITGLNSIIGVNSINGSSSNLGDEFTVSLRWVSWLKVTMDEKQMEDNITAINEYLNKWNDSFFNPRKIMVQFVDDRSPTNVSTNCKNKEKRFSSFKQYLLVTSI